MPLASEPTAWDLFLHGARDFFEFSWIIILTLLILSIIVLYIHDRRQIQHTIPRNYPVIGHLRYFFESLGEYFRQYFFAMDREELPFNRAERNWVYRAAKNVNTLIGFGSTRNLKPVGTIFFVSSPFPVQGRDSAAPHFVTIGQNCPHPYSTNSLFNISAMSYGAISRNAVTALSRGAKEAGCWMNTGEGGISPYHLEGGADLVAQIGTAKYGYRDEDGKLDANRLKKFAKIPNVKMFEIKLSQGAKPGKGGILPGIKVTQEIAQIRGIKQGHDSISPNRFDEISNERELIDFINTVRDITQKPVGIKFVLGEYGWLQDFVDEILKQGIDSAPDFITLDSAAGGTGASPMSLIDYMGLPIEESLPKLVNILMQAGLRDRIKIIASGKLITPAEVAWALCSGADFINSSRGFMFALGCIQALRCHTNTCPTGITSHPERYQRGLVPAAKAVRVANYCKNMVWEVGVISHSCGVSEPRELKRHHARIVTENGLSISLENIFPYPKE